MHVELILVNELGLCERVQQPERVKVISWEFILEKT